MQETNTLRYGIPPNHETVSVKNRTGCRRSRP